MYLDPKAVAQKLYRIESRVVELMDRVPATKDERNIPGGLHPVAIN